MSSALGLLLLLAPVGAIAWVIWAYQRKAGAKDARSRERVAALMALRPGSAAASGSPRVAAVAAQGVPRSAAAASGATRERFLTQPETLAYYLLKAGLPRHEIFARVDLAALLAAPETDAGRASDPQRLDVRHYELDFVVCDKAMRVVAAVSLDDQPGKPGGEWVQGRLAGAGVRFVRVNPAALPQREQIAVLVLGSAG